MFVSCKRTSHFVVNDASDLFNTSESEVGCRCSRFMITCCEHSSCSDHKVSYIGWFAHFAKDVLGDRVNEQIEEVINTFDVIDRQFLLLQQIVVDILLIHILEQHFTQIEVVQTSEE